MDVLPGKVKGASSPFAWFVRSQYKKRILEGDEIAMKEMYRTSAESWNQLGDKEKAHYYNLAKLDRKRVKSMTKGLDLKTAWRTRKKKAEVRVAKEIVKPPKKAFPAFGLFLKDVTEELCALNPDASGLQFKEASARWELLLPEEKEVYYQRSKEDSKRYKKEKKNRALARRRLINGGIVVDTDSDTNDD